MLSLGFDLRQRIVMRECDPVDGLVLSSTCKAFREVYNRYQYWFEDWKGGKVLYEHALVHGHVTRFPWIKAIAGVKHPSFYEDVSTNVLKTTRWSDLWWAQHTSTAYLAGVSCNPRVFGKFLRKYKLSVAQGLAFAGDTVHLFSAKFATELQKCGLGSRAASGGNLVLLQRLDTDETSVLVHASQNGHIHVVDWVLRNVSSGDSQRRRVIDVLRNAIEGGRKRLFEYVWRTYWSPEKFAYVVGSHNITTVETALWASNEGYCVLEVKIGSRDFLMESAIESGSVSVAKWCCDTAPIPKQACEEAASNGHLPMLRWLREEKREAWDSYTCCGAAANGHLEVLMYARRQRDDDGRPIECCPWDEAVCYNAVIWGHSHVLRWARANGAPWNDDIKNLAFHKFGYVDENDPPTTQKRKPVKRPKLDAYKPKSIKPKDLLCLLCLLCSSAKTPALPVESGTPTSPMP